MSLLQRITTNIDLIYSLQTFTFQYSNKKPNVGAEHMPVKVNFLKAEHIRSDAQMMIHRLSIVMDITKKLEL